MNKVEQEKVLKQNLKEKVEKEKNKAEKVEQELKSSFNIDTTKEKEEVSQPGTGIFLSPDQFDRIKVLIYNAEHIAANTIPPGGKASPESVVAWETVYSKLELFAISNGLVELPEDETYGINEETGEILKRWTIKVSKY